MGHVQCLCSPAQSIVLSVPNDRGPYSVSTRSCHVFPLTSPLFLLRLFFFQRSGLLSKFTVSAFLSGLFKPCFGWSCQHARAYAMSPEGPTTSSFTLADALAPPMPHTDSDLQHVLYLSSWRAVSIWSLDGECDCGFRSVLVCMSSTSASCLSGNMCLLIAMILGCVSAEYRKMESRCNTV